MNAFGIGYGVALGGCLAAALARWAAHNPAPADPVTAAGLIAGELAVVVVFGWLLVYGPLLSVKNYDARAAFRAADPRGWKSFAAGLLTGLAAVGVVMLVHAVLRPSGEERDLNTVRAGVLSLIAIGLGWAAGVALFLWWFRPRPPAPPADPPQP